MSMSLLVSKSEESTSFIELETTKVIEITVHLLAHVFAVQVTAWLKTDSQSAFIGAIETTEVEVINHSWSFKYLLGCDYFDLGSLFLANFDGGLVHLTIIFCKCEFLEGDTRLMLMERKTAMRLWEQREVFRRRICGWGAIWDESVLTKGKEAIRLV